MWFLSDDFVEDKVGVVCEGASVLVLLTTSTMVLNGRNHEKIASFEPNID
jgi:hypothetical protein